ncbi:MAG: DUF2917 domain-containing protein [Variovorax sp.]
MTSSSFLSATVSSAFEMGLPARSIYRVADAADVRITVRRGSVWITLDNDPVDVVLGVGEQFSTSQHRRALVSALEPSCISVAPAVACTVRQAAPQRSPHLRLSHFQPA